MFHSGNTLQVTCRTTFLYGSSPICFACLGGYRRDSLWQIAETLSVTTEITTTKLTTTERTTNDELTTTRMKTAGCQDKLRAQMPALCSAPPLVQLKPKQQRVCLVCMHVSKHAYVCLHSSTYTDAHTNACTKIYTYTNT